MPDLFSASGLHDNPTGYTLNQPLVADSGPVANNIRAHHAS